MIVSNRLTKDQFYVCTTLRFNNDPTLAMCTPNGSIQGL